MRFAEVRYDLRGGNGFNAEQFCDFLHDSRRIGSDNALFDFLAQRADGRRQFVGPCWSLAQPERNCGRLAAGIRDTHDTGLHTQDAP